MVVEKLILHVVRSPAPPRSFAVFLVLLVEVLIVVLLYRAKEFPKKSAA